MTAGKTENLILADGRWRGTHGIGRFSHEILKRLLNTDIITQGPKPLSIQNLFWLSHLLDKNKNNYKIFFNPGFNPLLNSSMPFVFTIHDLIHLHLPGKMAFAKKMYYESFIKPTAKKAYKIITVSEYSKRNIIEWANIPAEKIIVVGNGISDTFKPEGLQHTPGYPYLLHVGNTKAHKNVNRMIEAFSQANIDKSIKLILTGDRTPELQQLINQLQLNNRIVFCGTLSDKQLAEYYRGALAFLLPSLYEGFGIPVIEAMACGIPTLTANTTSLPEVAGDAAVLIDPYNKDSISHGIENIIHDNSLRTMLIGNGFKQCKLFSWDKTAAQIQMCLEI